MPIIFIYKIQYIKTGIHFESKVIQQREVHVCVMYIGFKSGEVVLFFRLNSVK